MNLAYPFRSYGPDMKVWLTDWLTVCSSIPLWVSSHQQYVNSSKQGHKVQTQFSLTWGRFPISNYCSGYSLCWTLQPQVSSKRLNVSLAILVNHKDTCNYQSIKKCRPIHISLNPLYTRIPKCLFWQTVKTQMMTRHFIRVYTGW